MALAFVLAHPSAPVAIIGTQTPSRIGAATAALGVHLDRQDVYSIIQASEGAPLP
jgi:predicted oxidoreductase